MSLVNLRDREEASLARENLTAINSPYGAKSVVRGKEVHTFETWKITQGKTGHTVERHKSVITRLSRKCRRLSVMESKHDSVAQDVTFFEQ